MWFRSGNGEVEGRGQGVVTGFRPGLVGGRERGAIHVGIGRAEGGQVGGELVDTRVESRPAQHIGHTDARGTRGGKGKDLAFASPAEPSGRLVLGDQGVDLSPGSTVGLGSGRAPEQTAQPFDVAQRLGELSLRAGTRCEPVRQLLAAGRGGFEATPDDLGGHTRGGRTRRERSEGLRQGLPVVAVAGADKQGRVDTRGSFDGDIDGSVIRRGDEHAVASQPLVGHDPRDQLALARPWRSGHHRHRGRRRTGESLFL